MSKKRYKPEEIVSKLRQVDVLKFQGKRWACGTFRLGISGSIIACATAHIQPPCLRLTS